MSFSSSTSAMTRSFCCVREYLGRLGGGQHFLNVALGSRNVLIRRCGRPWNHSSVICPGASCIAKQSIHCLSVQVTGSDNSNCANHSVGSSLSPSSPLNSGTILGCSRLVMIGSAGLVICGVGVGWVIVSDEIVVGEDDVLSSGLGVK